MAGNGDVSPPVGGEDSRVVRVQRAHSPEGPVDTFRRDVVLRAMVEVVAERGYTDTSVALVCAHAKVSRRAFYELFGSLAECFLAFLDQGMEVMAAVMSHGFQGEEDWLDGLLAAEAAVLGFLDSEPRAARVLLVEALGAGSWALERRERNVDALRVLIVERFRDSPIGGDFPPLASTGVMASLLGIMQDHLLRGEPAPLISLLGPLMGVITTPYLPPEEVAREIRRGEQLAEQIQAQSAARARPSQGGDGGDSDSDGDGDGGGGGGGAGGGGLDRDHAAVEVPGLLRNSRAERARLCVRYLAEQGRLGATPSNSEIAAAIGIAHKAQVSKLLARLEAAAIASKYSHGKGRPNAWRLTPYGEELAAHFEQQAAGAAPRFAPRENG